MEKSQEAFVLIIFGITGNLAQLKLIPALYDLAESGLLPPMMSIVGIGRKPLTTDGFRTYCREVLAKPNKHHMHPIKEDIETNLLSRMRYIAGDMAGDAVYDSLKSLFGETPACANKIYYLATYPGLYADIFNHLESSGLNHPDCGWVRVMIEKPIGTDELSSRALNNLLSQFYFEDQIYRLDHYLGRETLQNLLTFRFGNGIFEPIISHEYLDHIQVTAAEDFSIGERGGYYDSVGALKDVGQNHLLQMITMSTMDSPVSFSNNDVTDARSTRLRSLVPEPDRVVYGQYTGYRKEAHVAKDSQTDTFFAFRTHINSPRFNGVPIYVRGGKQMARTVTEVAFIFKVKPNRIFDFLPGVRIRMSLSTVYSQMKGLC